MDSILLFLLSGCELLAGAHPTEAKEARCAAANQYGWSQVLCLAEIAACLGTMDSILLFLLSGCELLAGGHPTEAKEARCAAANQYADRERERERQTCTHTHTKDYCNMKNGTTMSQPSARENHASDPLESLKTHTSLTDSPSCSPASAEVIGAA